MSIAREIGNRRDEGAALGNLGHAYTALGDARQAIEFYQQHLAVAREIDDRRGEAETRWNVGVILAREGHGKEALRYLGDSLLFHQAIHHPRAAMMTETIEFVRQYGWLPKQQPAASTFPDDIPEPIRQALELGDDAALQAELKALPAPEQAKVLAQLQEAGILGYGPDMARVLQQCEPLLRDIAAVARGDEEPRSEVEAVLPQLEQDGWQLTSAVQRIWLGERNVTLLVDGIDANSALLMQRMLELIAEP